MARTGRLTSRCRTVLTGVLMLMVTGCNGVASSGETVILQQGANGYTGCTATTLWGPQSEIPSDLSDDFLYLRGSSNHILIRFDLPPNWRSRRLARATLEVFLPPVRHLRMICEIVGRGVEQPWSADADWQSAGASAPWKEAGGWLDYRTDYGRGRPPGVVDSYELWEYDGRWFPHKYAFLAVPAGGKWIDFNVTPLVRKWLSDRASNHGVALTPVDLPDERFPNTAAADIPSASHAETAERPRLVLEFEPTPKPYLVGMTHTLRKFCDFSTRYRFFGPFLEAYEMAMARNEFEGFQVLIYPMKGQLEDVVLEWTDLLDADTRARIPKGDIECYCQPVFRQLHPNMKISDWYFHGRNFAMPDPLTEAEPTDIPEHMSTPFWFIVHTRPETPAGRYQGTIMVRPRNGPPRELSLTVKVWDYVIPEQWNHETMGQTVWEDVRQVYGGITPELKRKYVDFLLDHRFSPTEQYVDKLSPDLADIPYCVSRGMSTIYLSGNFTGKAADLRERYETVRKLGLIDKALVYIGDETSDWAEMRRRSDAIRRACPEVMIMIGGSFPRKELDGVIDIFDPQIDAGSNDVYSLPADRMKPLIAQAKAKGEKFFWYVAAGPMLPCPNVQMEDPLIASRVLFWLSWKLGVTGFEYYCYNIWRHNLPRDGKRWPEVAFSPRGWGDTNGDGMLFYPGPEGPFSSARFENIRDGIEDWESHHVLRDYSDALEARAGRDASLRDKAAPVLARCRALLEVPDEVCKDFVNWTWEPEVLLGARRELGDMIDEVSKLVTEAEMLAARSARKEAELARQRQMLRERSRAAE